jgi:hypothetical protein
MQFVKTSFDRQEDRRDRRYPLPPLTVVIGGMEYTTVNWSLGGCLISGFMSSAAAGGMVLGTLLLGSPDSVLRFSGTVVRVNEPEPGYLAVQFTELGEDGLERLDRYIADRMFRRRRKP